MRIVQSGREENRDPELTRPVVLNPLRKKGLGVHKWLLLDSTGQGQVLEAGKLAIMRRTGLPARDLRILDPLLSYPSTVLSRERAIVINLEHIKGIITAHEVLLINPRHPSVTPFIEQLQHRLSRHSQVTKAILENNADQQEEPSADAKWCDLEEAEAHLISKQRSTESGGEQPEENRRRFNTFKVLPFEFIALEACLEAACSLLENETRTLEQIVYPASDKLTTKISTLNLKSVRRIKSGLVAMTGRVRKVRDELEDLLNDDEDMADMYLTEKFELENSRNSFLSRRDDTNGEAQPTDTDERNVNEISSEATGESLRFKGNIRDFDNLQHESFGTTAKDPDVEELEMLLESYFIQIDGTLNKLSTVCKYF